MKTFSKEIRRSITHSPSRFWAIFAIVALGAGFFAGLRAAAPDMRTTGDAYYDSSNMMDIRIVSTLGLTDGDVDAVKNTSGIQSVMPAHFADVISKIAGMEQTIRVHSIRSGGPNSADKGDINQPILDSGRWPQNAGECVVGSKRVNQSKVKIGDSIQVSAQDGSQKDQLKYDSFKIVGIVSSPYYISLNLGTTTIGNGELNYFIYVRDEDFNQSVYTELFATVNNAKQLNSFSDEYDDTVKLTVDSLKSLAKGREEIRYQDVYTDAKRELDKGKSEYNTKKADADKQLADAAKKLSDGEKTITDNEKKLADAEKQTADGEKALAKGEKDWAAGQKEYTSGLQSFTAGEKELNENQKKYDDSVKQLDDAQKKYDDSANDYYRQKISAEAEMDAAQKKIDSGWKQIDKNSAPLSSAKAELDSAKTQLDESKKSLDDLAQFISALLLYQHDPAQLAGFLTAAHITDVDANDADAVQAFIAQNQQQYDAGLAQYNAGLSQYNAGLAQYEAGHDKIEDAVDKLNSGQEKLDKSRVSAEKQFADAEKQLSDAFEQLTKAREDAQPQLDDAKKQLDNGRAELELNRKKLAQAKADLDSGKKELDANRIKLASARADITSGKEKLAQAKIDLAKGKSEYEKSKAEADQKLADAAKKLSDGETELNKLKKPEWYVLDRNTNVGFASFSSDADRMDSLSTVFPLIFFLVAALVALTTMTRMVEEERILIGTYKALGYSNTKIASKYIIYAALASVFGSIAGILVGFRVLPQVVWTAYGILYTAPALIMPLNLSYALTASFAAVFCTLSATYAACHSTLKESPANLMLPRAPKAGKRILLERMTLIWSHLSFTEKVTARNLFRYKKRLLMTVIGIAGCTALLVTGYGVKDSVSEIVSKQFDEVYKYNTTVGLKDNEVKPGLAELLNDKNNFKIWMKASSKTTDVTVEDKTMSASLYVPQNFDQLKSFINLRDRRTHRDIPFDDNSVVLTEKLSTQLGVGEGGSITVKNSSGQSVTLKVTGVTENYVYHYVYISPALYESKMGEAPVYNEIEAICNVTDGAQRKALTTKMMAQDGVGTFTYMDEMTSKYDNMIQSMNMIILVLIISAGLLAFIVLYNLTNINVTERQRELATIKVLGFYDGEVSAYIFRETTLLTIIGCALGLGLGILMHAFVVQTAEIDMMMFGRVIKPMSFIWSAAFTMFFGAAVDLVMYRKLKKIDMVESLKSVD